MRDDAVAESINKVMEKRVTLHYEEKVGLPTSCLARRGTSLPPFFQVEEIPLAPGSSCRTVLLHPQRAGCVSFDATDTAVTLATHHGSADRARYVAFKEPDATVGDRRRF